MPKRKQGIGEMMSAKGSVTKKMDVKEEDQMIEVADVMEPEALPEHCPRVLEAMRKVRKAMYRIDSFRNVHLRELEDRYELTHGEPFMRSTDSLLSDLPYNIRSGREITSHHHDVLTLEGMEDAVDLCKWVMRPQTYGHLF